VTHSKRGGTQRYPLQHEVGEAILEYIIKGTAAHRLPASVRDASYASSACPRLRAYGG